MWSSLPCFCTFCRSAIPTSCYILNVFILLIFLAASAHAWAEVCHHIAAEVSHRQPVIYGQLTQALLHWQYWLKNHWPKRPFKHWVNPSLDGWQTCLMTGHPYIQAFKNYFTQSFRYIHINDRDLPQPFQVPGSIDNTMHTWLRPPMPSMRQFNFKFSNLE